MLYNAKRINFEAELALPRFELINLYARPAEKPLLNEKGQFFVDISEKTPYVRELIRKAQDLNLTVSGDGTAAVGKTGDIRSAGKGDIISFGSSTRFDVNWIKRDGYVCEKGYVPVYDIVKDWNKIEKALKAFAEAKAKRLAPAGNNVQFHTRFMVVDGVVIPYNRKEIVVSVPQYTPFRTEVTAEYELSKVVVLRTF